VKTHEIGAALLNGAFKRAVDLLLSPREDEREDAAAARAYFSRTRDAAGTLKRMPYYMNAERSILERLKTAPHDWIGSLGLIPRTLRMM
jgi:tRNA pseudouridine13 synthase